MVYIPATHIEAVYVRAQQYKSSPKYLIAVAEVPPGVQLLARVGKRMDDAACAALYKLGMTMLPDIDKWSLKHAGNLINTPVKSDKLW